MLTTETFNTTAIPDPYADYVLTIEEVGRRLNCSRESVYAAIQRGRLHPIKRTGTRNRRNFFSVKEVAAYRNLLDHRWPSKEEAVSLRASLQNRPHNDDGIPLVDERAWDMFVIYADDSTVTYEALSEQFNLTRQRIQQIMEKTLATLADVVAP
jgi:excisionase family DNA binding protein